VPLLSTQRVQVELLDAAIALQVNHAGREVGLMLTAIEHGDAMSARDGFTHLIGADVAGNARGRHRQDVHRGLA